MSDGQAKPVEWTCEAYGPDGVAHGFICFFSAPQRRTCISEDDCHLKMGVERERVFDQIHDLATAGDGLFQALAEEFTHPDQLLGGEGSGPRC